MVVSAPAYPAQSASRHGAGEPAQVSKAGPLARWIRRDPVRAVAVALIVVQLAVRADIASRGYLAADDYALMIWAAGTELTSDFLFGVYVNHMMPGAMLITWLFTKAAPLEYWPFLLVLLALQVTVSVAIYRLLRQLLPARWGLLVPLAIFLFSPLTLENSSWWWSGINVLPLQLAIVLAIGAQVKYVRTRRQRHLVALALSVLLGLFFFEKAILIPSLVFLFTACLFVTGGPVRSVIRAVARYWPSWVVLSVITGSYLAFYFARAQSSSLHAPASVREVVTFVRQLVGNTLIPGIVGGPWGWLFVPDDGAPLGVAPDIARWMSWMVVLSVVVVTVLRRRVAARAWIVLGGYVTSVIAMLSVSRLGMVFSPVAGLVPRYVSEVVVVAALCVGVALFGVRDADGGQTASTPAAWPKGLREPGVVAGGLVVGLVGAMTVTVGAAWSTARFADDWGVNVSRDYLTTARTELAAAKPGTVFFDGPVPPAVLGPLFFPNNLQSRFFSPLKDGPVFVDEAEHPFMFDDEGRIRSLGVAGTSTLPGPETNCGYRVEKGHTSRMPLTTKQFPWFWVVHIGYLSSADSTAVLRLGSTIHRFTVKRGLHEIYFPIEGGGTVVELTVSDPSVMVCVDHITIGNPVPKV